MPRQEHIAHWISCPDCGAKATDEDGGVMIVESDYDSTVLECQDCGARDRVKASIHPVFEWDEPERGGEVKLG